MLGATQQFTATVSNSSNPAVVWSVNGIPAGSSAVGTISATGLYTAPQDMPASASVTVQAKSQADATKSATASLTVNSDVAITLSPGSAAVELGATRQFAATISSAGNPDRNVTWSVSGAGCAAAACGTLDSSGLYTAPQILPSPASVTLTAKSIADPSRSASTNVTITSTFLLAISGPASLGAGASAQYSATLTPAPNSNPSGIVSWSVSGPGCAGSACGTIDSTGSYAAPTSPPSPPTVTITARPLADPLRAASLTVTIQPIVIVTIGVSPVSTTLAVLHRQTFSATVTGTPNQDVQWDVNGVAGGSATLGHLCAVASSPCQSAAAGVAVVDYIAPLSVPAPNPVLVTATSQADPAQKASATVTILAHVQVSVSPPSVTLSPFTKQLFAATVAGTSNQVVTWQISGSPCGGPGAPCGIIDPTGLYTAPLAPPSPNTLTIVAISADDPSRTGSAAVTLATGPAILALLPSSILAGAAGGFTLKVSGANFAPSSSGSGSTILVSGMQRTTTCPDVNTCTAILGSSDLAAPGSLPIQVRNPDGTSSNQVLFLVIPDAVTEDFITLGPASPAATGKDIVVVDTSTAGISGATSNVNLNVAALGMFSTATNSCSLAGNPLFLTRPASGTATADICAFSASGLDPSLTYTISGPTPGDITVVAREPLGLGIVRLTLQLSSTTQPGTRTLFIQNANKDKAAASGAIEVK